MTAESVAIGIVIALMTFAIVLGLFRLWLGPTAADRVVAIDVMSSFAVGVVSIEAIALDNPVFIDAAMVIALLAFLVTVVFAYYLKIQVLK